jgi:hypothetical protein
LRRFIKLLLTNILIQLNEVLHHGSKLLPAVLRWRTTPFQWKAIMTYVLGVGVVAKTSTISRVINEDQSYPHG